MRPSGLLEYRNSNSVSVTIRLKLGVSSEMYVYTSSRSTSGRENSVGYRTSVRPEANRAPSPLDL